VKRIAIALIGPLALLGVAHGLSRLSNDLLWIGPLDRAALGWLIVVPVWALAPVAGGFALQFVGTRGSAGISLLLAVVVTLPAALLTWQEVAFPACPYGASRGPEELVAPAAAIGAMVGFGLGAACFVASEGLRNGSRQAAIVAGAAIHLAASGIAVYAASAGLFSILGPACQRPPLG
jgi:hypothetical protein